MERTDSFWKPIFHVLEGQGEVLLAHAQHLKAVPGRTTDLTGAEWMVDGQHGLRRPSGVPPAWQRELRERVCDRHRVIEERSRTINRLQQMLEVTNITRSAVASDLMGLSVREMLAALLAGETHPTV